MKPKLTLPIGKIRGLAQCSGNGEAFSILALDHRTNLRNAINPNSPESVTYEQMVEFKQQVTLALAPMSTAVLLDPEFGASQAIASGALPGPVGLLAAVEATGYTGDPTARHSRTLPGWSVAKAKRMGANAVKALVYYHPQSDTAGEVEEFIRQVAADCAAQDIPLFLEPLSYSLDPAVKKLRPDERRRVVVETARRLAPLGADVVKAEFPLDVKAEPDQKIWQAACEELSAACPVPWVLLSASVDFETYLRQVTVACRSGASGVAVGRAVWQEAPRLQGAERLAFLNGPARDRMRRITALCEALARPWTDFYSAPELSPEWYTDYA